MQLLVSGVHLDLLSILKIFGFYLFLAAFLLKATEKSPFWPRFVCSLLYVELQLEREVRVQLASNSIMLNMLMSVIALLSEQDSYLSKLVVFLPHACADLRPGGGAVNTPALFVPSSCN